MVRKLKAFAILATGMFIAGVANAEAQQPELNAPDLVLVNGKVLTLDDRSTVTEAVAVADGKIIATGTSASIKALAGARTRVLDVSGKTVIPD
ncbi:imidazolonepropionase-like amidohydrolase [Bradyrhizobium sp. GM7.3]